VKQFTNTDYKGDVSPKVENIQGISRGLAIDKISTLTGKASSNAPNTE